MGRPVGLVSIIHSPYLEKSLLGGAGVSPGADPNHSYRRFVVWRLARTLASGPRITAHRKSSGRKSTSRSRATPWVRQTRSWISRDEGLHLGRRRLALVEDEVGVLPGNLGLAHPTALEAGRFDEKTRAGRAGRVFEDAAAVAIIGGLPGPAGRL